jgi:hypothetical protein
MAEELVTLWRYRDLPEALVAKSKLDSAALWCFLADENMVYLNWFMSNAIGGVRLQVSDTDAADAMTLLGEEIPAVFSAEDVGEEYWQPACPKCGSRDVGYESFNKAIALTFLSVVRLPVWIPKNSWKCEDCEQEWKAEYD